MSGPVSPSLDDDNLLIMGTCDDMTTLAFDLDIVSNSGMVQSSVYVEHRGDVDQVPCIQSCFAYTAVVPVQAAERGQGSEGTEEEEEWMTVRRLRVLTTNIKTAKDTESLTSTVDAEALAVVLFHKLHSVALADSPIEAQRVARNWLLSTLLCTYRSAELYETKQQARRERSLETNDSFYPSERLLGRPGTHFLDSEILLAQGHDRLCSLPLLVFSLLQCDALRPGGRGSTFRPSADARCAAAANMANMTPGALARCIAPRMELWLSGDGANEPLVESLGMSMKALRSAIDEHNRHHTISRMSGNGNALILLLDSPRQILLHDCMQLPFGGLAIRSTPVSRFPVEVSEGSSRGFTQTGKALRSAVEETIRSYRVAPPTRNDLILNNYEEKEKIRNLMMERNDQDVLALSHINDAMVEDSRVGIGKKTYAEWCTDISDLIHG